MFLCIAVILNLFQDLILFNCAMTIEEEVLLAWIILYKNFSLLFCIAPKSPRNRDPEASGKLRKNSSPVTKRTVHYGFAHLKTFVFLTAHKFYRRLVFCFKGQFIIYGSRTIVIVYLWRIPPTNYI